jgi:putative DNA primase/helicase
VANLDGSGNGNGKKYALTDLGNAERLVDTFGDIVRYVPEWKTWMYYDGVRWVKVDDVFMNGLAKQVLQDMRVQGNVDGQETDEERRNKDELVKWVRACGYNRRTGLMVEQARDAVLAHPQDFDINPWLVNAEDVTIDLRTFEQHKHTASDMVTKVTGTAYNVESSGERFLTFIDEVTGGDKGLARYIQKILGYSLSGVIREQHLFMPYGTGRNGKTVLFELIAEVLGEYAAVGDTTLILDQGNYRPKNFSLANLVGVRLVVFAESNDGRKINAELVKSLSGGDSVPAEAKFMRPFSFRPQFKMFLYINHLPGVDEVGDAMWERLRVIPFNECFIKGRADCHEPDTELTEKLRNEKPAILQWLVEGNGLWQAEGLEEPASVKEATKTYREDSDVLAEFLEACVARDTMGKVTSNELYAAYSDWYQGNSWERLESKPFGKKIVEHGYRGKRSNGRTVYHGLKLTVNREERPRMLLVGGGRAVSADDDDTD